MTNTYQFDYDENDYERIQSEYLGIDWPEEPDVEQLKQAYRGDLDEDY